MIVYDMLCKTLKLGTKTDIFATTTPIYLQAEPWWLGFREDMQAIYSTRTGVGARHDAAVAKKKKLGKKPVGRKEKGILSQEESQNLPTPAASTENTQVSQSSNFPCDAIFLF